MHLARDSAGKSFPLRKSAALYMVLFVVLSAGSMVCAQETDSPAKPAKLFESPEPLSLTLSAPWRDIQRKEKYQDPYPAKIEFTDELGNATSLNMTVERRGRARQTVCRFPPIRLRFEKKAARGTTFRGQKLLKMVTHCQTNSRYEQLYVLEMLAYRMYNLVTDFSFRVRPLIVTYVDSDHGKQQKPKFAFLIEDDSDVAKRNGQKKLKIRRNRKNWLDPGEAGNFALFQYMIANLDWSVQSAPDNRNCCHNVKLIGQDPKTNPVYAIPYDFDVAGLINAPYAVPPAQLPVIKVTQRLYRGFCLHNESVAEGRQLFLANEPALLGLVRDEPRLNSSTRKKALRYLVKFFDILKDERDFQKKIIAKCRK